MPIEEKSRDPESVAEHLATETGEDEHKFRYEGDIPDPEDLSVEDASEFYDD